MPESGTASEDDTNPSLLPEHTKTHLYVSGTWSLPGTDECPCEGAKYHSPRPLFTKDTRLVLDKWYSGGSSPAWAAPTAYLCGTCRDNLNILLQMLHSTDGDLAWEIRREFGNEIRALALRGWQWFAEHRPTT